LRDKKWRDELVCLKKFPAHPASCTVDEEGSFLGDIAGAESYKGLLILDPHEDFKLSTGRTFSL
jgi:hypothetical protein